MKNKICVYVMLPLLLTTSSFTMAEVYTWKSQSGSTHYSDAPKNLQAGRAHTVNIRTHQVNAPTATAPAQNDGSLSDQQNELNKKITDANKKIEEQNRKIAEENQLQKQDNCKAAQLNLQFASTARSNNRQALVGRYEADVRKYCSN